MYLLPILSQDDENENTFWDFATFMLPTISALMKCDDFFDYIFLLNVVTPNPHDSFMTQTLKGIPIKLHTCYKSEDELNKWIVE